MRVAAIVPCRNHGDLLHGCLQSFFLADGYDRRKLSAVVVIDGSDAFRFEEEDALVRLGCRDIAVLRPESPVGPAAARNLAIREAWGRTDAFAFLDADDEYLPGKVAASVAAISGQGDGRAMAYTDEVYEDSVNGKRFVRFREPFSMDALASANNIVGGSFVATKAALEASGLLDERMAVAEMHDLAWRLAEHSAVVHVPETLTRVRLTARSLRHSVPDAAWRDNTVHAAQSAAARARGKS